jgi:SAM-dependent methyltransferase
MSDAEHWDQRYAAGDSPWETGQPSSELVRVVAEQRLAPCRALELGCGTGASAIWLAQQGFDVTAVDISPRALDRARQRAAREGAAVTFLEADVLHPPAGLAGPFDFFFDRGCYHVVRRVSAALYLATLLRLTVVGSVGLVLAGNAREPLQPGPPVVTEEEIRAELGKDFAVMWLREFRFDQVEGIPIRPLGWSCGLRR